MLMREKEISYGISNMKFSLKPFSKGRRVPVAHKQGADRSGSGDFAGVWGRGAPVAHELAPTEPAGETQSPILLCEAIFSGCFPLLNQKKIPRSPFRELPERLRGNFYVC